VNTREICGHLLSDWVPSLPAAVGRSFIGWPPFLLHPTMFHGIEVLALRAEAGRCDRQWKSVLSWMLGVAGARHVLGAEGYRWIAPLSAFYPNAIQPVDLSAWHSSFPRSSISATRPPGNRSRLLPDYLALKSTSVARSGGSFEWAVAEAKGTQNCLTAAGWCPIAWSNQVRNVLIELNGSRITIPRHLVIATRVNPNAASQRARRLQVRAWNQTDSEESVLYPDGAVDIVAAHLFGLFKGLGLRENALALALSVQIRAQSRRSTLFRPPVDDIARLSDRAEREFSERRRRSGAETGMSNGDVILIETGLGPITVEIAEPLLTMARDLRKAETAEAATEVLQKADTQLDFWEKTHRAAESDEGKDALPFGVELRLPPEFEFQ